MIKVIGHTNLIPSDLYEESTVEECLEYFKQHKSIAVDTETQGKDPHSDKLLCLQIGDAINQWVIDCRGTSILLFKELLESKLCIIHNVSFDYKFLKKAGILLTKVWDTCITEAILYRGYQKVGYSLSAVCNRYCGVNLDKTTRGEFHTITDEPLTDTQIEYASLDVKYLHEIAKEQWRKATIQNTLNSVLEDNKALLAYADMEYYGNKIDVVKWSKNTLKNKERLTELKSELDSFVLKEPNLCNFLEFTPPDLFNTSIALRPNINWSSPVQVKNVFNALNINKGKLESVSEKILKYHTKEHPIVSIYLEYIQTAKLISTYGNTFIDRCINKVTNRVHTSYWIVLNTGRASSGGGDENPQFPNLQNIPGDSTYREMFVAEPGNVLITCDYSQLEPRVLADKCGDEKMIDLFVNGDGDTHTMTAEALYSVIEGKPVKIDKKDPRRQEGKILNLKLSYGGSAYTVKDDLGKTQEEAQIFIDALQKAFPMKKQWQDKSKKEALRNGYIILEDVNNSKCFIKEYQEYLELDKMVKTKGFWEEYNQLKKELGVRFRESPEREKVSRYFELKGSIERSAMNWPIQGTAAAIVKKAMILTRKTFIEYGIYDAAKLINQVHDELVIECPGDIKTTAAEIVKRCMIEAGKIFCKKVPMVVEPSIETYWKK